MRTGVSQSVTKSPQFAGIFAAPVHPMSGSISGAERRLKRTFDRRVLANPDVITDRAGR
jgi:hypothetical protein